MRIAETCGMGVPPISRDACQQHDRVALGWKLLGLWAGRPCHMLAMLFLLGWQTIASACTVPVFRYALDHWPSEPWQLDAPIGAFTQEPLSAALRNLGATSPLNLTASPQETRDVAKLYFPVQTSPEKTVAWQGKLDATTWEQLTNSPARKELTKRILAGESAVWVIVHGSDVTEHEALAARINKRTAFLESAAQLPIIDPNDPDSQLGPGPDVMLKFSSLKITRADPQETVLAAMLAGTKGLAALPPEHSFAALVFGRGRVLGAWAASDLSESFIDDTTLFLIKACSCQAKAQNPGWDLLMNTNWDQSLRAIEDARATPRPPPAQPEAVLYTPSSPSTPLPLTSSPVSTKWFVMGASALLGLSVWRWFATRSR